MHISQQAGPKSPYWKGDEVHIETGRKRARKLYKKLGKCRRCDKPAVERHHRDGNTKNNSRRNVEPLCRRCHMAADGRLAKLAEYSRAINKPIPPKPCVRCGRKYKPRRKGLCGRCYDRDRRSNAKAA